MEQQASKDDEYLPGLAYFDAARGIIPAPLPTREVDFSWHKIQRGKPRLLPSILVFCLS